jgi:hypothetical protein
MNDPATAEVWQTAFGKDFGGMAQGDNKTGQKGMNAMFIMTQDKIAHTYCKKKFFTFANQVVDYRPQKDEPNCIRITAMGNLITCDGESSVRTVDINTVKLHWNSVVSTPNAKYMRLHTENFYLTAAFEYFEYMKMLLSLFPVWIVEQYGNNTIKRQRLRSMEMQYFWVGDKVAQDMYTLSWHPGQENLVNYQSKHHIGLHHQAVCPWYLHQADSHRVLPRALKPSALKGVLEHSIMGTYANYPYHKFQGTRALSILLAQWVRVNEMCLLTL